MHNSYNLSTREWVWIFNAKQALSEIKQSCEQRRDTLKSSLQNNPEVAQHVDYPLTLKLAIALAAEIDKFLEQPEFQQIKPPTYIESLQSIFPSR